MSRRTTRDPFKRDASMSTTATLETASEPRRIIRDDPRPVPIAYPPAQAAIASGRTRTRIFGAIKSGELKARKDGKATIIEHEELMRWVRSLPAARAKA
jgi:hypothetical protein